MKKILYGICGIGMGHTYRQLPIIEQLAQDNRIMVFAYGASHKFYKDFLANKPWSARVEQVSVPFFVGDENGLNFKATAERNAGVDHLKITSQALADAQDWLGKPDLVISDYEPISAQYAYAHGAPLITIDQQSKYLVGKFPPKINGQGYADEVARLRLFFPRVDSRIACSFFGVTPNGNKQEKVTLYPPIIKQSILKMKRQPLGNGNSILVYISSQQEFVQEIPELVTLLKEQSGTFFQLFLPRVDEHTIHACQHSNVTAYAHGDARFDSILQTCTGIITTGGHTLLSEAMHLGIPCFVVPLAVYEQQMNAYVIETNGFGVSRPRVDSRSLSQFIESIPAYAQAIKRDQKVLLRGSGEKRIIGAIKRRLNRSR